MSSRQHLLSRILKNLCLLVFVLQSQFLFAQLQPIGQFDHHQDIGGPKLKGSVVYNAADQTYTMSGAGVNMWTNVDQFHFIWKKIKGDFIIRATVKFEGQGAAEHRKIGIIARDKLTTDSRYADACVHGDDLTSPGSDRGGHSIRLAHDVVRDHR